jgi:hypothetical protein
MAEGECIVAASAPIIWAHPSEHDTDRSADIIDAFVVDITSDGQRIVGAGALRGNVLHKLMEELLNGELPVLKEEVIQRSSWRPRHCGRGNFPSSPHLSRGWCQKSHSGPRARHALLRAGRMPPSWRAIRSFLSSIGSRTLIRTRPRKARTRHSCATISPPQERSGAQSSTCRLGTSRGSSLGPPDHQAELTIGEAELIGTLRDHRSCRARCLAARTAGRWHRTPAARLMETSRSAMISVSGNHV